MKWMRFAAVSLTVAAWAGSAVPAFATPGQTLAQFQTWSAQRPLLRGLVRSKDELSGWPAFDLLTADHGIGWHFHAATNAQSVQSEYLGVGEGGGDPGSTPIRHDGSGYGFVMFKTLYGNEIAGDFLASSRIAVVTDTQSHVSTSFYRGKRFGYEIANGFLTLATPLVMTQDLARLRKCLAHPGTCDE